MIHAEIDLDGDFRASAARPDMIASLSPFLPTSSNLKKAV